MALLSLTMAERARYYVSLGDSMSIDAYAGGAGCGASSLLFRNRDDDFSDWTNRDLRTIAPGARLIPLAADGATSANVRYVQLPKLREMGVVPEWITLTVGGNDLLSTFGDDDFARAAHGQFIEHLHAILTELFALAPDARIAVGTIYDPSDGRDDFSGTDLPEWTAARTWLTMLNASIRHAQRRHGVELAAIHDTFLGHGLLAGNPAQIDARPADRELYYCGTIEPNAWGASAIRRTFWDALGLEAGVRKQ